MMNDRPRPACPRRPLVVFNPSKAVDPTERKREVLAAMDRAGIPEPRWLETTPEDPGAAMTAAAVADGGDGVFACGGDGTVRACITALAGTGVPLIILAAGTGNLLAGNLDIPEDLDDALALVRDGAIRCIDVGVCGDERFAVMGGLGFDAAMIEGANEHLKSRIGWAAYILSGFRNLRRPAARYRLTFDDGNVVERRAQGVLVGNVGRLEAGLPVLPDARPDDGLIDVAVLAPASLREWAALAARIVARRRPQRRVLETFRTSQVRVEASPAQPIEFDGDACGTKQDVTIRVDPGALRVYAPAVTGDTSPRHPSSPAVGAFR